MMKLIKQRLAPPTFDGDEKKTFRARFINVMLNSGLILIGLTLVGNFLDSNTPLRNFIIDFCIIGVFLFLRYLLFTGRVQFVAYVSIIVVFVFQTISMASEGTTLAPTTALFSLLVIVAGFFFGLAGIVVAIITSSLIVAGMILARHAGILPPPHFEESAFQWFVFTITFGLTGGLAYFSQHQTQKALKLAENEIRDRKKAEAELKLRVIEVENLQQELIEQAIRDPLTELYNRRYLNEIIEREIVRANREQTVLSVIISDIDHFKMINDKYGHEVGDKFLVAVASIMEKHIRGSDIACRYGGEEFLLVLPGISMDFAVKRAEEIRQKCAELIIQHEGENLRVTMSFGVATYPDHGQGANEIIIKADDAMYQSKHTGRNKVTALPKEESSDRLAQ